MAFQICGIQQLGVGVKKVYEAWDWYRENFGQDVLLSDAPGEAVLMQPYTNHLPQSRHTIMAFNMQGGGGLEIWQYKTKEPKESPFKVMLGDLGTFVGKIKTPNAAAAYISFKDKHPDLMVSESFKPNMAGVDHFFVKDPYGNFYEVVECADVFMETKSKMGGVYGAIVGVSDMKRSIDFYKDILGYDTVVYDKTDVFEDFANIPGGADKYRRVLLGHSQKRKGPFSNFFGDSQIELVQLVDSDRKPRKIYDFKEHIWGDPGFIQICYDIRNMKDLKEYCESKGCAFTCDSNPEAYESEAKIFDMGGASGHFTYIEDPDGNLIEFVETYYVPIVAKFGLGLNLKKRNPEKALPNFVVKGLRFLRKDAEYSKSDTAAEKSRIADEVAEEIKKQQQEILNNAKN